MYKYTDKILKYLNKQYIKLFRKAKALTSFDELNVIPYSRDLYRELERLTKEAFLLLAKKIFEQELVEFDMITEDGIFDIYDEYHPITKFVFNNEIERKRGRFAEGVIASPNKVKEIDTSMRYWVSMVNQYAIDITDRATLTAYEKKGVKKVQWVAEHDDRTCGECAKRDGKVYDIDKVPPKVHYGCRCKLIPYKGE